MLVEPEVSKRAYRDESAPPRRWRRRIRELKGTGVSYRVFNAKGARHSRRNARDSSLRALRIPLRNFALDRIFRHHSIIYFSVFSHAGSGRSTISHLTLGSFSFDNVKGRRMATAKSTALTSFSQAQRILVFAVSLPIRFVIV